jgi:hypothetical protein
MKTAIVKSLMVVVVVIAMVHYALYLKTGRLPWDTGVLNKPLSAGLPQVSLDKMLPTSSKTKVYKWVDEQGVTNFSQEPPPAAIASEVLEVDANVNLIQSTPVMSELKATAARPRSILIGDSSNGTAEMSPIEKAQAATAALEARNHEQKKILDSL